MNSIFIVTNAQLSDNGGRFSPTVLLTDALKESIREGKSVVRKGQWIVDGRTGSRGQFVGVNKKKQIVARGYTPGAKFSDYQRKLAA